MHSEWTRQTDIWQRWNWAWHAIFYGAVLIATSVMLIDNDPAAPRWVALLLTGCMLLWHYFGLRWTYRGDDAWLRHARARLFILIGDGVFWFVLVLISPAYYFALFGLFLALVRHVPFRYAAIGAFLLGGATIVEQWGDTGDALTLRDPTIWLFFLFGLISLVVGNWIAAIIDQSTQRRELLEQLAAAQHELGSAKRREGMLEERQRLAREIHDTLAQGFTSIVLHLEAADAALPHDPATVRLHLARASTTARASLTEARRAVQDLRPDLLEHGTLVDAIARTAARWQSETGIDLKVDITGNPIVLLSDVEITVLRAMQEALNNIWKFAQATTVQVTLSYMDDVVMLDVHDNGVGLNGATPSDLTGGYGLAAMRERVEQCGGSLTIESEPGDGMMVTIRIPLRAEQRWHHESHSNSDR